MKLLVKPLPARMAVMAAARRRGWSWGMIGAARGVSHQAVQQQLAKYEKRHGPIVQVQRRRRKTPHNGECAWSCKSCGAQHWSRVSEVESRGYCNKRCAGLAHRVMADAQIVEAIDLRRQGFIWKDIAIYQKQWVQVIQSNIWYYLKRTGMLKHSVVRGLWHPVGSDRHLRGRWNWLIDRSGFVPE